ncbi:MAG: FAD-dependent monooxygenase [Hyphomicrobiaceae bacterium]
MAAKPHILIAGAGIGGLTTALALLQRGFTVRVYEQAPELMEVGAGVQIAANGSRLLIALGLRQAMEQVVCPAALKIVRIWNTGQTWKLFDLGADSITRFGAPYWFVHRGDMHRALMRAVLELDPAAISAGRRVTGFDDDGAKVTLRLAEGGQATGDVLIGADGVHSTIRQQLFEAGRPEFMGIICWRGLAPMQALPEELRQPVGTNWVGPGGHVITYPLRRGEILNFVGFGERDDWKVESWTEKGSKAECAADFPRWHPLVHEIISKVDQPYKWALIGREPMPAWTKGRVTLVGDACHPMLPFLAQGANSALEDGVVLARCLDAYSDTSEALKRYETARIPRTTEIVNGSVASGRRFHNPTLADPVEAISYVDREWQPDKVRLRYDWLFEYDATKVEI